MLSAGWRSAYAATLISQLPSPGVPGSSPMKGGPPCATAEGESATRVRHIRTPQNSSTARSPTRAKRRAAIQFCFLTKRGDAIRTNPYLQRSLDVVADYGLPQLDLARNPPLELHPPHDDRRKASTSSWAAHWDDHLLARPGR